MTDIVIEEQHVYLTPRAKRISLVYTLAVVAVIIISFFLVPAYGAMYGIYAGSIGIIAGIIVRIVTKRENKRNNVARVGLWLSSIWVGINVFVYFFVIFAVWAVGIAEQVGNLVVS